MDSKVLHPVDSIRERLLSITRRATAEGASGAVEGAMAELKDQLPRADESLQAVLSELSATIAEFRERVTRPGVGRDVVHDLGEAFAEGTLTSLDRHWNDGTLPFRALELRIEYALDRLGEFAAARSDEARTPGFRARAMVEGATSSLHDAIPQFHSDLRSFLPLVDELGSRLGRSVVQGVADGLAPLKGPVHDAIPQLQSELRSFLPLVGELGTELGHGVVKGVADGLAPWRKPALTLVAALGVAMTLITVPLLWHRR